MGAGGRMFRLATHTLVNYLKGKELALSSWVTPVADIGLVGYSGFDSPPRERQRHLKYNVKDIRRYKLNANKTDFIKQYAVQMPWTQRNSFAELMGCCLKHNIQRWREQERYMTVGFKFDAIGKGIIKSGSFSTTDV